MAKGKKTGGRATGTPNKVTTDIRQWITEIINDNRETVLKDLKELEPKDRLVFFEKLLKYAVPTLQATSLNVDFEKLSDEQLDEIINRLKDIQDHE